MSCSGVDSPKYLLGDGLIVFSGVVSPRYSWVRAQLDARLWYVRLSGQCALRPYRLGGGLPPFLVAALLRSVWVYGHIFASLWCIWLSGPSAFWGFGFCTLVAPRFTLFL